jgi:hypothetical protein
MDLQLAVSVAVEKAFVGGLHHILGIDLAVHDGIEPALGEPNQFIHEALKDLARSVLVPGTQAGHDVGK